MDIVVEADFGNAPKKALVRGWLISAAEGRHDAVVAQLAREARWEVVAAEGELRQDDGTTHRFAHLLAFDGHGKNATICEIVTFFVRTDR